MLKFLAGSLFFFSAMTMPAMAKIIEIEENDAQSNPIYVSVVNGQSSPIIFNNDQIIDYVSLSDLSQSVYKLNAPIDSGNTTSIELHRVSLEKIPGSTSSDTPNLQVHAIDANGKRYFYEFMLKFDGFERDRVTINPAPVPPPPEPEPEPEPQTTIKTKYGDATPEDVALGIEMAIEKGRIPADGSIPPAAKEYVSLVQNGIDVKDALMQTNLGIAVVSELAALGQEEDARRRILPLPKNFGNR